MKTEDHIDELIRREKETVPNPYLSTRVMAKIEGLENVERRQTPFWQAFALAAGFAAAILLGVSLGNSYVENGTPDIVLNINDAQMENLQYYLYSNE